MSSSKPENDSQSAKGTFIAIGLCVLLYFLWTQYLQRKYPDYNKPKSTTTEEVASQTTAQPQNATPAATTASSVIATSAASPAISAAIATTAKMAAGDLVYNTNDVTYTFSQELGSPTSVKLKSYKQTNTPDSPSVELMDRPLVVQALSANIEGAKVAPQPYEGKRSGNHITFTRQDGTWNISQEWTLPESGYAGKLTTTWKNTSAEPKPLPAAVLFEMGAFTTKSSSSMFVPGAPNEAPRVLSQADGSDDFHNLEKYCKDQSLTTTNQNKKLDFFGFDHHYFAAAFVPATAASLSTKYTSQGDGLCSVTTKVTSDLGLIPAGGTANLTWDTWFGPKEVELLTDFNPHLRTTLGLGWLDMIAHPLLLAIKGFHKYTGNYGIAIILLTLLLKILFFPLARQAAISAARMKKLNPEMTKLREKYKAEPQKMQMELMKFMSQNKINPMKGCLPMLPTIPVFFALFRVLSASIDLRHAPFYGWIFDLSAKDPYYITPIILTGCMFVQQKMTPMTGMDPTQEKVMMMMPLIFGVMMVSLPSGLVLYMLTNTIVTIAQQQFLNKRLAATI